MNVEDKIEQLGRLGEYILEDGDALAGAKVQAQLHNAWFTEKNVNFALESVAKEMLDRDILNQWVKNYKFHGRSQKVGLILAGNIPLVGFHDLMCCYLSGHHSLVKTSSKDSALTLHLLDQLDAPDSFTVVDRLTGMDAVIATGSNHSADQFERYFAKYPRIIRRNRNAVAVLGDGTSEAEIVALGRDVFTYFGLGCRNVSKIYIPDNFDEQQLMRVLHEEYKELVNHTKYKNNYDYNHAIYLLNGDDFLASGAVLFRRHTDIVSRIACLHYEEYVDRSMLRSELLEKKNQIQCISGNVEIADVKVIPLGECQRPAIDDYADGVDTMKFLSELSRDD